MDYSLFDYIRSINSPADIYIITNNYENGLIYGDDASFSIAFDLMNLVRTALPKGIISLYEAFQLSEISDRLRHKKSSGHFISDDALISANLALAAKLFGEEKMYAAFCEDARMRNEADLAYTKQLNGGILPEGSHYILDDLESVLNADIEKLELMSSVRPPKRHRKMKSLCEPYHWEYFPYDFAFEDELVKSLKSGVPYKADKKISPEICELMTAAEVYASDFYRFHNPGRWKNVHYGTDIMYIT